MPSLTVNEARGGFTDTFKFTYTDLQGTSYLTSSQKVVATIPAGGILRSAGLVVNTAAAGATDITISVGTTSGTPVEAIATSGSATDLDALTKSAFNTGTVLVNSAAGYIINNTTSSIPVYAKFGGTFASLTAGEWVLAFGILDIAGLANNA